MQEIIKYQEIDSQIRALEAKMNNSTNRKNALEISVGCKLNVP